MKSAVVVFPGINRERDMMLALETVTGSKPVSVWHTETELPKVDLVVVPGGFSYGDYLRCGAIAARSPIMQDIRAKTLKGLKVLGVCNGFQIITEAGLLPGVLVRNKDLRFVCRQVKLKVENNQTFFTNKVAKGTVVSCPVAHGEGNYICDAETLKRLEAERHEAGGPEAGLGAKAGEGLNPLGDLDGSTEYKLHLVGVLAGQAHAEASSR